MTVDINENLSKALEAFMLTRCVNAELLIRNDWEKAETLFTFKFPILTTYETAGECMLGVGNILSMAGDAIDKACCDGRPVCPEKEVRPEKVIFNDPATIVLWSDGTKTVTKCGKGDEYDPLFGVMACVVRKIGRNRVSVDAWEWVIQFLADNLANSTECRLVSDMLAVAADAIDLDGVMEDMEANDAYDGPSLDELRYTPDHAILTNKMTLSDEVSEQIREQVRQDIRDLVDKGEL